MIDRLILSKWLIEWENSGKGRLYKAIFENKNQCPTSRKVMKPRYKEVVINRLKFHMCRLNAYLYKIGLHSSGLCDICEVLETVQHFLFECTKHTVLTNALSIGAEHIGISALDLHNCLTNTVLIDLIYKYVTVYDVLL